MLSVATLNEKGGVGKSTLLIHTAAVFASEPYKLRVFIADMDKNATSYRWGELRALRDPAVPRVRVEMAHPASLGLMLAEAKRDGADLFLIDTPQGTDMRDVDLASPGPLFAARTTETAVAGAHVILIPTKPNIADATAILKPLRQAKGEGRSAYVVFNEAEPGAVGDQDIELATRGIVRKLGTDAPLFCPVSLRHHVEFPHAERLGLGVTEHAKPQAPASREIRALARWLDETFVQPAAASSKSRRSRTPSLGNVTSFGAAAKKRSGGAP